MAPLVGKKRVHENSVDDEWVRGKSRLERGVSVSSKEIVLLFGRSKQYEGGRLRREDVHGT